LRLCAGPILINISSFRANFSQQGITPNPQHRCKPWAELPKIFCRRISPNLLISTVLPVNSETPALAVIDGTLCQLTREGTRAAGHAPLATAVLEFRHGSLRYYVREHRHGLLPGMPNLYCLDGAFRLQWMAEWPDATDPCAAIIGEEGNTLVAQAQSGAIMRLDATTGRLLHVEQPMAAAI
jgi:hypothetical protein